MRRPLRWLLVAGLVCAGLTSAAEPPAPPPGDHATPAPSTLSAALLYSDRPSVLLDPASADTLEPALLEGLAAAWLWSDRLPPVRLTAEDLRAELARLSADGDRRTIRSLRVRVPPEVETPEEDLHVVAAPRAMFGEVPEGWLPRRSLSRDGTAVVQREAGVPWRLRLVGHDRGSAWREVSGRQHDALLVPVPAGDLHLVIADASGNPLPEGHLSVLEELHGSSRPAVLSQQRAGDRGVLHVPAVPADLALSFVAGGPGCASRAFQGRPTDLPGVLRLPSAATIRGRFVDADGRPVPGVELRAEGWLADELPVLFARRAESDGSGDWEITGLPPRRLALLASRDGYAPLRQTLEPEEGASLDLGELGLVRGADLPVVVRDEEGAPVAGAVVRAGTVQGVTDDGGRASLEDLPAGFVLELWARAEGFLEGGTEVPPPWPPEATITLIRAFTVRGSFLGVDGEPVTAGSVRVERGSSFRFEELDADGRFALHLEPGVAHSLRFASPTTARLDVEVSPGLPGEERDLGELAPPPGVVVRGTLLSAVDGLPVAGARVWTPRPSPDPVGAWFHGDHLETRSDELGRFTLGGLAAKPEVLRVDATGYARRQLTVQPESGVPEVDLGDVELSPGAVLRVHLTGAEAAAVQGVTARLDLRRRWLDLDMLTAVVVDGTAELPHVPAGEALLTLLAGDELLCEETVVVEADDAVVEVECGDGGQPVTGVVLAADRPVGPGLLEWRGETETGVMATILNRDSALGLRQQQVVGRGRPPVRVQVLADGTFTTDRLPPGRWSVSWQPTGGSPAAPREVVVPEGPAPHVAVRIAGGVVSGRVSDDVGEPVAGAWVRLLDGSGAGRTEADGRFVVAGLDPGPIRLQARDGERFSRVVEVWLEDGRDADPVELTLSAEHGGRLAVQVWSDRQTPATGAFVFLDLGRRGVQVVSADGDGRAELVAAAPYPERARLAAFHDGRWAFGEWTPWDRLRRGASLEIPECGEILVESEERRGALAVRTAGGWDLSGLLALLGSEPYLSPRQPLVLGGLPEGVYDVGEERSVSVRADHRQRVELD